MILKIILQIILMPFPFLVRRFVYRKLWKYDIDKTARIGFSLILCHELTMKENTYIQHLTVVKPIDKLFMSRYARIGSLNFITGYDTSISGYANRKGFYKHVKNRHCELILGEDVAINSRHFIDCNGGVYIGAFATVAGIKSQILTHSINVYKNRQEAHPIHIGKYCFVGTGCILLPGTRLPDYSVLGAGAVLTKSYEETACLYAGSPAQKIKSLDINTTLYFQRNERMVY